MREDPERLLSFGEAAELLRVPDMVLGGAVRDGLLVAVAGWRRGRLTRLVRAGDLECLDPTVGERVLPPRIATEPLRSHPSSAESPPLGEADPSEETAPEEALLQEGGEPCGEPHLGDELRSLEEEVRRTRDRNQRLMEHLARSTAEVEGLFDHLHRAEQTYRRQLERDRERVAAAGGGGRLPALHGPWSAWALAAVALLGTALLLRGLARDGAADPDRTGGERSEVHAASRPQEGETGGDPSMGAEESIEISAQPITGSAGPVLSGLEDDPVENDLAEKSPAENDPRQEEPGGLSGGGETSPIPTVSEPEVATPSSAPGGAAPPQAGEGGEGVEYLTPPPAAQGASPCHYFALTRPGSELRSLLGPCSGPWIAEEGAVAGVIRREGRAFCRHHAFFVTRLGGSIERARAVALFAAREGFAAPLVELRVERAAAAFLRNRVGEWIESGFEGGATSDGHRILPGDEEDHFLVESWVRYLDVGTVEHRRRFRMRLTVDDGPRGDRLTSFEWLDEANSDAAADDSH